MNKEAPEPNKRVAKSQNYTFDGFFLLQVVIHAYSSLHRVGLGVQVDDMSDFAA